MKAINHNSSDEDLLLQWQQGDVVAFDLIFKRYFIPLCKYAQNNLKQAMLAEELVMDVLLRIWKTGGNIHCPAGFRPYILRALKNAILNHFRGSMPPVISLEELPAGEEMPAATSPDHKLFYDEARERYLAAIASLSDKKREVFVLSREESLTYKEIARHLNISVNTVENYMSASLSQVKEKMK
ncbi:MAG: RNA polymerase sigma factor [Pseudobacter sp.]|uniref:RNA polymerase sigma factor n=1 Tax=Pseudobacter sp. TaxID=2045420 RepID=UPI003F7E335B